MYSLTCRLISNSGSGFASPGCAAAHGNDAFFLKTSGGKGLHLDVPIEALYTWDTVGDVSKALVVHMAKIVVDRFSAKSGPSNRKGKIFIDYLRNGKGATTACAWSARARPGLGISVRVTWKELDALTGGDQWTIANASARIIVGNTPWEGYRSAAARLTEAMDMLSVKGAGRGKR